MTVRLFCLILACWAACSSGCALTRPPVAVSNPIFVPADNSEAVWERTVDVVHHYFEIDQENKLNGVIETKPKVGASLLEPWHRDTRGFDNRLEASLQSIRRRGFVNITPTQGGYLVSVEVFKEQEDLPGLAANSAGAATFQTANPLQRDLNLVVGQSTPSGWIILGRDQRLEQAMLADLQATLSR